MQMNQLRVPMLAIALVLASGCSRAVLQPSIWVDEPAGKVVPSMANEVPRSDIHVLDSGLEAAAVSWMRDQDVDLVGLSDLPGTLAEEVAKTWPGNQKSIYLVRAVSDGMPGLFEAFASSGGLLVLYSHLGECGRETERVIAIRRTSRPVRIYAGCSGAL